MTKKLNAERSRNYEVGRGKPPKHTQFKKGQSGNPLGRKRTPEDYLNWKDPVFDVLLEDMTILRNGREVEMPAIVLMLRAMRNRVIAKSCPMAFKVLIDAAGHGGLPGLWWALKERKREKDGETIRRELEEAERFFREELPKFGTGRGLDVPDPRQESNPDQRGNEP
jgi:hypothetical protein